MYQPRILVPAAAALVFLGLALLIVSGRSFSLDTTLIMLFRDAANPAVPLGPAWFQEAVRDMTALGSFIGLFFMALTATLALWLCGYRRLAVGLVVSLVAAFLASTGLKIAIARERPDALLPTLGGQTGLNLAMELVGRGVLEKYGVELIGAKAESIETAEDREKFKQAMIEIGLKVPASGTAHTLEEAEVVIGQIVDGDQFA